MVEHWIIAAQAYEQGALSTDQALKIVDGIIAGVIPAKDVPAHMETLHWSGLITPGFVDLQVNGGGGVLFNHTPAAAGIAEIAAAHHALGTAAIMPTVITDAPEVLDAATAAMLDVWGDPRIAGLHIEGPHIDPVKRGTHAAEHIRPVDRRTLDLVARLRAADMPVMITLAPEAATLDDIAHLAGMGAIVSLGHSNCDSAAAQAGFAAGAGAVTHLFNAMSQMQGRAPGLTGAAIASDAAVGMICDGVHVADEMLALALRARPDGAASFIVSDAMPTVGGPDQFQLYGQDIRLKDGRLVNAEGNLAGAHTTMAAGVERLVTKVGVPLQQALDMAIATPGNLIKSPHLAQLQGRNIQDVILLDPDLNHAGSLLDYMAG